MTGLLRANVRQHGRRYVATGIAVAISTAFVLVCLIFTQGLAASLTATIRDSYTGVAVYVDQSPDATDSPDFQALATQLQSSPGVGTVQVVESSYLELTANGTRVQRNAEPVASTPFLVPVPSQGALPTADDQILIDEGAAQQLGVGVGDPVDVLVQDLSVTRGEDTAPTTQTLTFTVSGVVPTQSLSSSPRAVLTAAGFHRVAPQPWQSALRISSADGSESPTSDVQTSLAQSVQTVVGSDQDVRVRTASDAMAADLAAAKLGQGTMTAMLLAFPLIAVLVASIVVSSTFQVVLQQRTRELALLRTIGATRSQVRRLLLQESFTVGALSSLLGVVLAYLLGAWGLEAAGLADSYVAGLTLVNPLTMLGVWALGTLLTVLLGMGAARAASRVSPMAALQPVDESGTAARRSGRVRAVIGLVLAVLGGGVIWMGLHVDTSDAQSGSGVLMVLAGCGVCLIGLLMTAGVALPVVTHLLGRLAGGAVGRMARENSLRNRRRTASTGTAIVIGVTLVTTLLVGTASTRAGINQALDKEAPIDLLVSTTSGASLSADIPARVQEVAGVQALVQIRGSEGTLSVPGGETQPMSLLGEPDLTAISRAAIAQPSATEVQVSPGEAVDGQTATVCAGEGSSNCTELRVVTDESTSPGQALVAEETLARLAPEAGVSQLAVRLSDDADADRVQTDILSLDSTLDVSGSAPVRAQFTQVLDVTFLVLLVLLGVSVLVALVGVTNTLSLSVAERTRENGLLRALGLTKRQMKRMLLIEALLISGSGALAGIVMGVGFGLVGTKAVFAAAGMAPAYVLPWWQLGAAVLVMVLAAVVASWWPGRRAARTSPVEALASE